MQPEAQLHYEAPGLSFRFHLLCKQKTDIILPYYDPPIKKGILADSGSYCDGHGETLCMLPGCLHLRSPARSARQVPLFSTFTSTMPMLGRGHSACVFKAIAEYATGVWWAFIGV